MINHIEKNYTNISNSHKPLPELLAPAGSFDCLKAAVQNGADAVYLGLKKGSARMGAENFTFSQLEEAISYAHLYGVKVYLAQNTLFNESELDSAYEDAKKAASLGIDAIILQDLGLATKIFKNRKSFPCEIHASTQMSVYNETGTKFLEELGFDRCITARELSIKEIENLCANSNIDIEIFCHGALCMSVSGQCLLSSFIGGRSGNRGTCAQPCRMKYALHKKSLSKFNEGKAHSSKEYTTSLAHRLSPADFASLPYLRELVKAGVQSLKIEGRLKSPEYVAQITKSYRNILDDIGQEIFDKNIDEHMKNMQLLFGRGAFTSGYLKKKLPFEDITFHTAGRIGLNIGKLISVPTKLPSPKNLPSNLTRFTLKAVINEKISLQIGDGITVYNFGDQHQAVCGGTINSISTSKKGNITVYELTVVGKFAKNISSKDELILSLTDDCSLREELNKLTKNETRKININIFFKGRKGKVPILKLSDEYSNEVSVCGENIISKAEKSPVTKESIYKQLTKLGDTPFEAQEIQIEMDNDIFIPVSHLNDLRRKATSNLISFRQKNAINTTHKENINSQIAPVKSSKISGGISFFFYDISDFLAFDNINIPKSICSYQKEEHTYYIPLSALYKKQADSIRFSKILDKIIKLKKQHKTKIIAYFNLLSFGQAFENVKIELPNIIEQYLGKYIDGFMLENLGDIYTLKNALNKVPSVFTAPIICCDYSFNTANSSTMELLHNLGINRCTLSPENFLFIDNIKENINTEIIVGGPIILMRSRHCFIDEGECSGKCSKCLTGDFSLIDSQNCEFPILPQKEDCCSILLSHKNISLTSSDIKNLRSQYPTATLRINIYH